MKIFRKCSFADSTGDAIPFYHNGVYHIFSLTPPKGTTVYPARLRTTWEHTTSKDLVHWEEQKTALFPGEGDEPDACGVWTGSVVFGEGKYHAFYTGYNLRIPNQQTICHAESEDGLSWVKDPLNPVIPPKTDLYEQLDWRDPYVFYNEDDKAYWILISARRKEGPPAKRGCVILYRSDNLKDWTYYGPIYQPYHTNCPECPEMYKIDGTWFLSYSKFSEFGNTIYRTSSSPFGPWKTPKMDGIGGRRFYAAKSMVNDEGRRFYFAWIHDRADESDQGEWYWGGRFCVPHEVVKNNEGELDVKIPKEIAGGFDKKLPVTFEEKWGKCKIQGNSVTLDSPQTLAYGFFKVSVPVFLFTCKIRVVTCGDQFGLLFKSDEDGVRALMLSFDRPFQRVSLLNLPMGVDPFWEASCTNIGAAKSPGPDGVRVAEKPFAFADGDEIDIKAVIDNDIVEVFVGEKVAFTYRSYEKPDREIGIFVQDAVVEFNGVSLSE